ncbi:hypothetical protein EK0264_01440 [Epidermidibacterium keratini]|uniref:Uncharacterized protein n=1 Tax=Epidermidibacterium keratini TaxID=1891644 RepID=A0A7L4YI65_9ACTN|nr:hypothetical protein [Epidermidibacterium keratini]QHB99085.1 hypothetical protein EK0264_01440 [Epidermidibacterium keratini]
MRRRWIAIGIVVAIAASLVWVFVLRDRGTVEPGRAFALATDPATGPRADVEVKVPFGTLRFTIRDVADELPSDYLADPSAVADDQLVAGSGSSLIVVRSSYAQSVQPIAGAELMQPPAVDSVEVAVAGGQSVQIPDVVAAPSGQTWVVVVPEADATLDDLLLVVTVAGESQIVSVTGAQPDEIGAAEGLYQPNLQASFSCDQPSPPAGTTVAAATLGCQASLGRAPYQPDLGWAGDGRTYTWLGLELDATDWQEETQDSGLCDELSVEASATIGNEQSTPAGLQGLSGIPVWRAVVVVPSPVDDPPDEVSLSVTLTCTPGPDGTPLTETFTGTYPLSWM